MLPQQEALIAGEVRCLNCSAVLADVVRCDDDENRFGLRPARFRSEVQVDINGPRSLRCRRCNGRALVEIFDNPHEAIQVATRGKQYTIA